MLKWTLPAGVLLALACSGELPELPGASSEPAESTPSAPQAPSAQPVSTGQDAPPVEAIPAVVRICAHDGVQEMVEGWGQRSSTPAGVARLCQAQYMAWKADLDAINPALSEGLFESLADCLEVPSSQWEHCYADYTMELGERLGSLPPMPGPAPEEIAAQQGPPKVVEACVALCSRFGQEGFVHRPERLTSCVDGLATPYGLVERLKGEEQAAQIMDELIVCLERTPVSRDAPDAGALLNQCTQAVLESAR